jgi:hypothetical protein
MKKILMLMLIVGSSLIVTSCGKGDECTCTVNGQSETFDEDDCDCDVKSECDAEKAAGKSCTLDS